MEHFKNSYMNTIQMNLFSMIKTNNVVIDSIISTCIMSLIGMLINYVYDKQFYILEFSWNKFYNLFHKRNIILLEGKKSSVTSAYTLTNSITSSYSDRFKAVWDYIIKNIENNNDIYQIKESISGFDCLSFNNKQLTDIFIVYQNKHFLIDKDIYAYTQIEKEEGHDKNEKHTTKTDIITIEIYSYKLSLIELKNYIENITSKYLSSIKDTRLNKQFVYYLDKVDTSDKDNESKYSYWREDLFESSRNFNNIYFDGKQNILDKLDFFMKNKKWYDDKGIPYTIGFGLHGPPGTGKTSLIKAIANYTNRHIVVISPKLIKTKNQLEKFFFEDTYNQNNEKGVIGFNNKIIVFEDIDCIGDIVLERNYQLKEKNYMKLKEREKDKEKDNIKEVLESLCDKKEIADTITLDDILNLWDGIRETPGRIIIITSNNYDKLDTALTRPGRIDVTHKLDNASHRTISEIYTHLFNNCIDEDKLKQIKEYFYSPAELINIFVSYKNEDDFINRLLLNKKI
jgi:hypothetical protein